MAHIQENMSDAQFCELIDISADFIKWAAIDMDDNQLKEFIVFIVGDGSDQGDHYLCMTLMRTLSCDEHAADREFWLRVVIRSPDNVQTRIASMLEFGALNRDGNHYDEFASNSRNSLTAIEALQSEI